MEVILMTLLNLLNKQEDQYQKLRGGDISVLNNIDAATKIRFAYELQKEFGTPTVEEPKETLADAYAALLKREREVEEFKQAQRKAHLQKEAKAWVNKIESSRYYY